MTFIIIELVDDESDLERQQEILDEHDDNVAQRTARVEELVVVCSSKDSSQHKIATKRLKNIEKGLDTILSGASALPSVDDRICLIHQYQEQLSEFKAEFAVIRCSLFRFDLEDPSELNVLLTAIERRLFDCSLEIKKLLYVHAPPSSSSLDPNGVKLPKLDVPTFDGSILNHR